jgi:hypothetical protein
MARAAARKKEVPVKGGKAELSPLVVPVMEIAEEQGLLATNDSRVTARLSSKLLTAAKVRTGIRSDSDLVKFAIAQLVVDDPFKTAFRALRGSVDPDIDLEF